MGKKNRSKDRLNAENTLDPRRKKKRRSQEGNEVEVIDLTGDKVNSDSNRQEACRSPWALLETSGSSDREEEDNRLLRSGIRESASFVTVNDDVMIVETEDNDRRPQGNGRSRRIREEDCGGSPRDEHSDIECDVVEGRTEDNR